jgi:prepilin-type processing-associated H-X9-DG protein
MIFLADSIGTKSTDGLTFQLQTHGFLFTSGAGLIHLRHNGLANIAFADGHVAACDKAKIKQNALADMAASSQIFVAEADGTPVQLNP